MILILLFDLAGCNGGSFLVLMSASGEFLKGESPAQNEIKNEFATRDEGLLDFLD